MKKLFDIHKFSIFNFIGLFQAMCIHMAAGKCTVLEIKCKDPSVNVVCEFRKLCGPRDPVNKTYNFIDCICRNVFIFHYYF